MCQSDFNVEHSFSKIDQHVETKIHKKNCKTKLHLLQPKLEKVDSACYENEVSSSGETQTASVDLSSEQQIKSVPSVSSLVNNSMFYCDYCQLLP